MGNTFAFEPTTVSKAVPACAVAVIVAISVCAIADVFAAPACVFAVS